MNDCYVYGLFRPDTGAIFYVGMGRNGRAWSHQRSRKKGKSHKDNIICKCIDELGYNEIPVVFFREGLSRQEAIALEITLIQGIGRRPNGPLVNVVRGGEGLADPPPEFRVKHGRRMRIVLSDPSIRDKMSKKAKARDRSGEWEIKRRARMAEPEVREKMRAAKLGKPSAKRGKRYGPSLRNSEAQSNRIWITDGIEQRRIPKTELIPEGWRRGHLPASVETRRRLSEAHRGRVNSAESNRKRSETAKQTFADPELRKRLSDIQREIVARPETSELRRKASLARWAKAKARKEAQT